MRQPIQYALTYPYRFASCVPDLDWSAASRLEFMPPDKVKFPCVGLAYRAMEAGGTAPAALNAADEVAVQAFLAGRIRFTDIPRTIQATLDANEARGCSGEITYDNVMATDGWARQFAGERVGHVRIASL
jgi:1-deoxy-D-xylulose-5-phosphate reductoisomerase